MKKILILITLLMLASCERFILLEVSDTGKVNGRYKAIYLKEEVGMSDYTRTQSFDTRHGVDKFIENHIDIDDSEWEIGVEDK